MKNICFKDNNKHHPNSNWFPIDNAGKIFPSSASKNWNMVFRISAVLNNQIDSETMQKSLDEVMHRFPIFQCKLKKGFFWYFFEKLNHKPYINIGDRKVCAPFELLSNEHLFRICVNSNRIAIEIFHSVTDGCGAIVFFNTLLKNYFENSGNSIKTKTNTLDINDSATIKELEDSYLEFADFKTYAKPMGGKASKISGTKMANKNTGLNMLEMKHHQLKMAASKYNCTVTEFLNAVLLQSASQCQMRKAIKKPVVVEVPMNLRNFFPSNSLRNFTYITHIKFDQRKEPSTLEYLTNKVKLAMKNSKDRNWILSNINSNVKIQKSSFLCAIPLNLKNIILKIVAKLFGERSISYSFSALGKIQAPEEFTKHINRYECAITPPKTNSYACSSVSFNNNYILTFSKNIYESEFEKNAVKILRAHGVDITLETNMATKVLKNLKCMIYHNAMRLD